MKKLSFCALVITSAALAKSSKDFFEYENPYENPYEPKKTPPVAPKPPVASPTPKPLSTPMPTHSAPTPTPVPVPQAPLSLPIPQALAPAPRAPAPVPAPRAPVTVTPVPELKPALRPTPTETKSAPTVEEEADLPVVLPSLRHDTTSEESAPVETKRISSPPIHFDSKLPLETRIRFRGEGPAANWWNGIKSAPRGMEFGSVPDPQNSSVRRNGVLVTRRDGSQYFFMNTGKRAHTQAAASNICRNMSPKGAWKLATQNMKLPMAAFQAERDGLSGGDETMWLEGHNYLVSILGFAQPVDQRVNGVVKEGLFVATAKFGGGAIANTQSGSASVTSAYRSKFDLYAKKGGLVFCATGAVASKGY